MRMTTMRFQKTLLAAALVAALSAAGAAEPSKDADATREQLRAAREELRAASRRIAELSAKLGAEEGRRAYTFRYMSDPDRAMIGIVMDHREDGGVSIAAVTPGGPAEKAGVRTGDRLIAVNGKEIAKATPPAEGKLSAAIAPVEAKVATA